MPANIIKTPRDEKLWSKAKAQVEKEYGLSEDSDRFYAFVNGIYRRMKGMKKTVGVKKTVGDFIDADIKDETEGVEDYEKQIKQLEAEGRHADANKIKHILSQEKQHKKILLGIKRAKKSVSIGDKVLIKGKANRYAYKTNEKDPIYIPVNRIKTPYQTEASIDEDKVKENIKKIKNKEALPPLIIGYNYDLHDGHHKLEAAKALGHTHVPCIVEGINEKRVQAAERRYRKFWKKETPSDNNLEKLASAVHDIWCDWAKHISRRVNQTWRDRWKKLYVPYEELPEEEKQKDRDQAKKILAVQKSAMVYGGRLLVKAIKGDGRWITVKGKHVFIHVKKGDAKYIQVHKKGQEKQKAKQSIDQKAVDKFIDESIGSGKEFKTLPLREVSSKEEEIIEKLIGKRVTGYVHELSNFDLQHALKGHGNKQAEAKKGQLPITEDDLKLIPDIINSYDGIEKGSSKDKRQSIIYRKQANGDIFYVEVVLPREGKLRSKTMWKKPVAVDRAVSKTPRHYTSENDRNNTSSNFSIKPSKKTVKNETGSRTNIFFAGGRLLIKAG